ncbi:MAG TPA: protease modulator HflK [Gemmataceae bacterium]|nr:protease modulator HflK [Gemmataceae bacterium]
MLRILLIIVVLVFAGWTIGTSFTRVQSHERAVVRRFGRILDTKPEPGLHIGLPWGIDRVDLVPVGPVHSIDVGYDDKAAEDADAGPVGQMLTGDHNVVNVLASINYRIRDQQADRYVLQANNVNAFVARAAEALLAEWIAGRKVDEVLRRGKADLPRFLHDQLQTRIQEYDLGIDIEHVSIKRLEPPAQVKEAFDQLAHAQTGISTKVNQAREAAERRRSEAEAEEYRLNRSAKAYAREERLKADAEADSFTRRLAQYRELSAKNPEYLNAVWLDRMTRLFQTMRTDGRLDLLDHYLSGDLSITQFPLPKKR